VRGYDVVLYLHIMSFVLAVMVAGTLHTGLFLLRGAKDTSVVKVWAPISGRLEKLFPIFGLLLFIFGAWLLSYDGGYDWGDPFVVLGIIGLVVIEANGGTLLRMKSEAFAKAAEEAPAGAVPPSLHALCVDRVLWAGANFNTCVVFGIVFDMVYKPDWAGAIIALIVGAVVGVALALPFTNPASKPTESAATAA
jgi:hypothetical protein